MANITASATTTTENNKNKRKMKKEKKQPKTERKVQNNMGSRRGGGKNWSQTKSSKFGH